MQQIRSALTPLTCQRLLRTWQLIIKEEGLSVLAATEKTGIWQQFSMCSVILDSRRCLKMSGVTLF